MGASLLSCNSSSIEGVWIASYSISHKGDTMSLSQILDFYTSDSVSVQSLFFDYTISYYYKVDNNNLSINNDSASFNYKFYQKHDKLHLFIEDSEDDTIDEGEVHKLRTKEIVYFKSPELSTKTKLSPDIIRGPFALQSEELGTDTLEFVNDSLYIFRNNYGYKDIRTWRLHTKKNIQFIELWVEYNSGNPVILSLLDIDNNSFTASPNTDEKIKIRFTPIKDVFNKPDITGTWTEDSIMTIRFPFEHNTDTIFFKTNLTYYITQDSIICDKYPPLKYISDYTGKELISMRKKKDEDGKEYDEYYHYEIIDNSNEKIIFGVSPRIGKYYYNFHYLTRYNTK